MTINITMTQARNATITIRTATLHPMTTTTPIILLETTTSTSPSAAMSIISMTHIMVATISTTIDDSTFAERL
jgi:hypothetical protein